MNPLDNLLSACPVCGCTEITADNVHDDGLTHVRQFRCRLRTTTTKYGSHLDTVCAECSEYKANADLREKILQEIERLGQAYDEALGYEKQCKAVRAAVNQKREGKK